MEEFGTVSSDLKRCSTGWKSRFYVWRTRAGAALRADLGTLSNRYLKAKHRGVSFPVGDGIRWPVAGWELCPRRNFHERMLAQRGHCQVGRRHPGLWTNELLDMLRCQASGQPIRLRMPNKAMALRGPLERPKKRRSQGKPGKRFQRAP